MLTGGLFSCAPIPEYASCRKKLPVIISSLWKRLMEQDRKINVEEIMGHLKCPKDFQCCMSGLEDLCKAKSVGDGSFLVCAGNLHPPHWKYLSDSLLSSVKQQKGADFVILEQRKNHSIYT
jgi:hypothetical protein